MLRLAALLCLCISPLARSAEPAHRVLAADRSTGKQAIVGTDGKIEWLFPNTHDVHDAQLLENGNLLTQTSSTKVVEVSPEKKIVWSYDSKPKAGYKGGVEVHAFQRLVDGNTMIAEAGNGRIIEVDPAGKVVKEVPLKLDHPHPHRDTRRVRKLDNGHYLVAHEGDGCVREYDDAGKVVWEYKLDLAGRERKGGHGPEAMGTEVFSAIRLKNGNTLIGTGNMHEVQEVDPKGKIVWSVTQNELPGITLAWVTGVQQLKNGNIVIGNCHAGKDQPQLIEVTKDKKVVWTWKDWTNFGDNTATAIVIE